MVNTDTRQTVNHSVRFAAFPATEYNEVLLGYQPGQMVEQ